MPNHEPRTKRREKICVQHFCWLGLACIFGHPYGAFRLHTTMVGMDARTIHGWMSGYGNLTTLPSSGV